MKYTRLLLFCLPAILLACQSGKQAEDPVIEQTKIKETTGHHLLALKREKEGYKELAMLVLNEQDRNVLNLFIDTMGDYTHTLQYQTNLNFILDFIESNGIPFLIRKNENNGIFNSTRDASRFMKYNFNKEVDLSAAEEKFASNDFDCAIESDRLLREHGFQYGFIDTRSDENIIIIHRCVDEPKIRECVEKIGYEYFIADA